MVSSCIEGRSFQERRVLWTLDVVCRQEAYYLTGSP